MVKGIIDIANWIVQATTDIGGLDVALIGLASTLGIIKSIKFFNSLKQGTTIIAENKLAMKAYNIQAKQTAATTGVLTTATTKFGVALKSVLGVLGLIGAAYTIISSIISLFANANEDAKRASEERISKIETEIDELKALKDEYNDIINSTDDQNKISNKLADNFKSLTNLAKAYGIALNDLNGEQKDYLTLANEVNVAQLKQIQRESGNAYETAKQYLEQSSISNISTLMPSLSERSENLLKSKQSISKAGNIALISGTPKEQLKTINELLDVMDTWTNKTNIETIAYNNLIKKASELTATISAQQEIISSYEENADLIKFKETMQSTFDDLQNAYTKWATGSEYEMAETAKTMAENLQLFIDDVISKYPTLTTYITTLTEDMLNAFDTASKIDTAMLKLDEKLSALKQQKELNEAELEIQQKLLAVEKAREELAKAKANRVKIFRAGKGFVYEEDSAEVQKAQEGLSSALEASGGTDIDIAISNIEKLQEYYNQAQLDQSAAGLTTMRDYFASTVNLTEWLASSIEEKFAKLAEFITSSDWNVASEVESTEGYVPSHANGTLNAQGGMSKVGEKGPELRVLNKGDGIIPADITKNLMSIGKDPSKYLKSNISNDNKTTITIGTINLPDVSDVSGFIAELTTIAMPSATKI